MKNHKIIAYTADGNYIKDESFSTADEAFEAQMNWVENKTIPGATQVVRIANGHVMTVMDIE